MGQIHPTSKVLLLLAASSRYCEACDWAHERAEQQYGGISLISQAFDFTETDYYAPMMGTELKKQFLAFRQLIDPAELAAIKCETNEWEVEYAALGRHAESRPLNLDPGYITAAKLVLASTKDHAHRLYLRDGIYAEVTLVYRHRRWQLMEWTYPDYRREDYQQFFTECRELVLNCGDGSGRVK